MKTNAVLIKQVSQIAPFQYDDYSDIETESDCDSINGDLEYIDVGCDLIDLENIFLNHKTSLSRQTSEHSDTLKYIDCITDSDITTISATASESAIATESPSYAESVIDSATDLSTNSSTNTNKSSLGINKTETLYCSKCLMKKQSNNTISKITIFNIVNEIIFSSTSMPEVYEKMDKLIIKLDKWFELNDEGLSVFHWFIWYISTKIKKYNYVKSRVFAFFQKVFSDNTVRSIFGSSILKKILILGTPSDPNHTLLYHLVRYCENPNDVFYIRVYNLLLERGAKPLTDKQLNEIKKLNSEEEDLPCVLKQKISSITDKYKLDETKIVEDIEKNHSKCKLNKCLECEILIDYTKEIPKIIAYAKENNCDFLLNNIWSAYYQRKLVNTVFDKYYNKVNAQSNLNMIHKRHSHILDVYRKNLIECNDSNSPTSIINIYSNDSDTMQIIKNNVTTNNNSIDSPDSINKDIICANNLICLPTEFTHNVKCLG